MKIKYIIPIALFSLAIPFFIYTRMYKKVNPDVIVDNLHKMFDSVSFISVNHKPETTDLLGIQSDVFTGMIHTTHQNEIKKYHFIANAYTGDILEITS